MNYLRIASLCHPIHALTWTRDSSSGTTTFDRSTSAGFISPWFRKSWRGRVGFIAAAAMAIVLNDGSAAAGSSFTITNTTLPGVAYSSVICGEFNSDGKPDVLVSGANVAFNGICQVWQNQLSGVFTNSNATLPGVSSSAVARGDFDNDGRADLLLTGFAGVNGNTPVYVSQVWRNLGNGSFTNVQAGLPGVDTGAVALGDLDNDGNLDILLTGYSATGAVAQVWRNLANGTFTNLNAGLPGVLYSSVALGDYDNDGRLDILLTGTTNGFGNGAVSQLWRNLGNGAFSNTSLSLPGVTQGAVAWGDFNQDGKLDILLTGYTQTGVVCQVWRNLGNGSFTNMNAGLPGVYQSSVALADYDNDGKLDILLAGVNIQSNLICQVWRNTGNWVFTNLNAGLTGIRSGSLAWADFDGDGRLDLLLSGLDTNSIPTLQVYHNNAASLPIIAPRITGLKSLTNRGHLLSISGQTGFSYTVLGSTNLVQWIALGTPNEAGPGTYQFTDPPGGLGKRFYRIKRP